MWVTVLSRMYCLKLSDFEKNEKKFSIVCFMDGLALQEAWKVVKYLSGGMNSFRLKSGEEMWDIVSVIWWWHSVFVYH